MDNLTSNHRKHLSKNFLKKYMIKRFHRAIISLLKPLIKENSCLLDAGCGEGFVSDHICRHFENINITGTDNNESALRIARMRNERINYENKDIYNTEYESNSFDVVICLEVLEHLKNPLSALRELLRITKTKVVISVPNEPFFSLGNLLSLKNIKTLGNDPDHINIWTFRSLKKWLKKNKIKTSKICSSFPWTIVVCEK